MVIRNEIEDDIALDTSRSLIRVGCGHVNTVTQYDLKRRFNYSQKWLDSLHDSAVRQCWIN